MSSAFRADLGVRALYGIHYGVTVPDLPGCFSAGESVDDALRQVMEAIDLHFEGLVTDNDGSLPEPQSIAVRRANPDFAEAIWALVDFNTSKYEGKAEKFNITVPRRVLHRIDSYASDHGETRSGFLARAALEVMRSEPITRTTPARGVRDGGK